MAAIGQSLETFVMTSPFVGSGRHDDGGTGSAARVHFLCAGCDLVAQSHKRVFAPETAPFVSSTEGKPGTPCDLEPIPLGVPSWRPAR
jgi:hypothetical protein